jgi:hypothetical protein
MGAPRMGALRPFVGGGAAQPIGRVLQSFVQYRHADDRTDWCGNQRR